MEKRVTSWKNSWLKITKLLSVFLIKSLWLEQPAVNDILHGFPLKGVRITGAGTFYTTLIDLQQCTCLPEYREKWVGTKCCFFTEPYLLSSCFHGHNFSSFGFSKIHKELNLKEALLFVFSLLDLHRNRIYHAYALGRTLV